MGLPMMVGNVMNLKVGIIVRIIGTLNVTIVMLLTAECSMSLNVRDGALIETT